MGSLCSTDTRLTTPNLTTPYEPPNFQLADFKVLCEYPLETNILSEDPRITTDHKAFEEFKQLIAYLSRNNKSFEDSHFVLQGAVTRLNHLHRRPLNPLLLNQPNPRHLIQNNDEYTYLSAVFCYVADMQATFKDLFCTIVNNYCLYVVRMFPNGKETLVPVDNLVPTFREKICYSSSRKPEIWMSVLEKAWAKMVGSYDRAKGLSPEDAIQEILGIPAYSTEMGSLDTELQQSIKYNKIENACVLFIAKQNVEELKGNLFPRQVFYLEGMDVVDKTEYYRLVCPFENFGFTGELMAVRGEKARELKEDQLQHKNVIRVSSSELLGLFEFCTFGYYRPGYTHRSLRLDFSPEEGPLYLKFTIHKEEYFNIRLCQYFEGYVRDNYNYSYSSVYLRLWSLTTKELVSEGCRKSIYCVKSSNVFPDVFGKLIPGDYLLYIDIPWKFPSILTSATLVTYSIDEIRFEIMSNPVEGVQLQNKLIIDSTLPSETNREGDLEYGVIWKRNSVFLLVNSLRQGETSVKVSLRNSKNMVPLGIKFARQGIEMKLQEGKLKVVEFRKARVEEKGDMGVLIFQVL